VYFDCFPKGQSQTDSKRIKISKKTKQHNVKKEGRRHTADTDRHQTK